MGILSFFRSLRRTGRGKDTAAAVHAEKPAARRSLSPAVAPTSPRTRTPVLRGPVVTEKATLLASRNEYAFRVDPQASKPAVRQAVERTYGVHVEGIRVMNVPGKLRRRGRILGSVPGYRKALVTLREGERIEVSPGAPVDPAVSRPGS